MAMALTQSQNQLMIRLLNVFKEAVVGIVVPPTYAQGIASVIQQGGGVRVSAFAASIRSKTCF